MIWVAAFAIRLTSKQKKEIMIRQHYLLFSISEPLTHHTQSNQMHTYEANWKGWVDSHGGELMSHNSESWVHLLTWQIIE